MEIDRKRQWTVVRPRSRCESGNRVLRLGWTLRRETKEHPDVSRPGNEQVGIPRSIKDHWHGRSEDGDDVG